MTADRRYLTLDLDRYLAVGADLTAAQHGALILLIAYHHRNGTLPEGRKQLIKISGLASNQYGYNDLDVILHRWPRIMAIMDFAMQNISTVDPNLSEIRRNAARARWCPHAKRMQNGCKTDANCNAKPVSVSKQKDLFSSEPPFTSQRVSPPNNPPIPNIIPNSSTNSLKRSTSKSKSKDLVPDQDLDFRIPVLFEDGSESYVLLSEIDRQKFEFWALNDAKLFPEEIKRCYELVHAQCEKDPKYKRLNHYIVLRRNQWPVKKVLAERQLNAPGRVAYRSQKDIDRQRFDDFVSNLNGDNHDTERDGQPIEVDFRVMETVSAQPGNHNGLGPDNGIGRSARNVRSGKIPGQD